MGLVNYSDSDSSDNEKTQRIKPTETTKRISQPVFKKVVDKSNPGKIRVSLPQLSQKENEEQNGPPCKKARINEGASIGFNSLLPAPKRCESKIMTSGDCYTGKDTVSGVNSMTETEIGRSKESHTKVEYTSETKLALATSMIDSNNSLISERNTSELKPSAKPLMFKPLCVSRKTIHIKKKTTSESATKTVPAVESTEAPKISLFSLSSGVETPVQLSMEDNYPLVCMVDDKPNQATNQASYCEVESPGQDNSKIPSKTDSLFSIAESLHLSSSEKRQLFGRQIGKGDKTNKPTILNFSTDMEYLHNEKLRAAGEKIVHNPVRAITPGKHSLKQLVNAVQSQKDALEESFAKGKNNRAEASSRYGW